MEATQGRGIDFNRRAPFEGSPSISLIEGLRRKILKCELRQSSITKQIWHSH